jgi:ferredoxin
MPNVTFIKHNLRYEVKGGTEFLRLYELHPSIPLKFGCRHGQCGTCAIQIIKGAENLSSPTKQEVETLDLLHLQSRRLACQCAIKGDVVILEDVEIKKNTPESKPVDESGQLR